MICLDRNNSAGRTSKERTCSWIYLKLSVTRLFLITPIMTGHLSRQGNVTCYIISIYLILITLRQVGEPILVRESHR